MAKAFQDMLERFGLTQKILAFNADNATANDKQTTKLSALDNSFDEANRVRCFNHTLQLSAKALLQPFHTALSGKVTADESPEEDNDELLIQEADEEEEEVDEDEEDKDDVDDGIDELQELDENERVQVLESTAVVRETVSKVGCCRVHAP
jgi:hypothetical protein